MKITVGLCYDLGKLGWLFNLTNLSHADPGQQHVQNGIQGPRTNQE